MASFLKPRSWIKARTAAMLDTIDANAGSSVGIELLRAVADLHNAMKCFVDGSSAPVEKRWIVTMVNNTNYIVENSPAYSFLNDTARKVRIELNGYLALLQVEHKVPYILYGKE
jgi:hypothetical protein